MLLSEPFASKLVNYLRHSESLKTFGRIRNRRHSPSIAAICQFSNILQRLTVPRIIDLFRSKRCQKKRNDVEYKLR